MCITSEDQILLRLWNTDEKFRLEINVFSFQFKAPVQANKAQVFSCYDVGNTLLVCRIIEQEEVGALELSFSNIYRETSCKHLFGDLGCIKSSFITVTLGLVLGFS